MYLFVSQRRIVLFLREFKVFKHFLLHFYYYLSSSWISNTILELNFQWVLLFGCSFPPLSTLRIDTRLRWYFRWRRSGLRFRITSKSDFRYSAGLSHQFEPFSQHIFRKKAKILKKIRIHRELELGHSLIFTDFSNNDASNCSAFEYPWDNIRKLRSVNSNHFWWKSEIKIWIFSLKISCSQVQASIVPRSRKPSRLE